MIHNDSRSGSVYQTVLNLSSRKRRTTNLSIGILKLQFLFDIDKLSKKITIIFFISIFAGICNFFLLERTGLYSLGIASFFQAAARCTTYFLRKGGHQTLISIFHPLLFWGSTLLFNIPLAFWAYKKVGKNFTFLSLIAIIVSSLTSITLSFLPENWGLKSFYIFSDPKTYNKCLTDQNINILQWNYITSAAKSGGSETAQKIVFLNDSSNLALLFFYGFIFGVLNTITSLVIYALGGSGGGIDWIVFYMSKKKMHSTNNIFLYFGLVITLVSYIIGTYVPYFDHITGGNHSCSSSVNNGSSGTDTWTINGAFNNSKGKLILSNIIGPVFVSTTIAAFTKKILFNIFYPHFKLINVKIFTNQFLKFRNILLSSNFPHSFTINTAVGGYLLRKQTVFEITCFTLELKTLMDYTRKIDPSCLIIATPVKSLSGRFHVKSNLS